MALKALELGIKFPKNKETKIIKSMITFKPS